MSRALDYQLRSQASYAFNYGVQHNSRNHNTYDNERSFLLTEHRNASFTYLLEHFGNLLSVWFTRPIFNPALVLNAVKFLLDIVLCL